MSVKLTCKGNMVPTTWMGSRRDETTHFRTDSPASCSLLMLPWRMSRHRARRFMGSISNKCSVFLEQYRFFGAVLNIRVLGLFPAASGPLISSAKKNGDYVYLVVCHSCGRPFHRSKISRSAIGYFASKKPSSK